MKQVIAITICLLLAGCAFHRNLQSPFTLSKEHPEKVALLLPLQGNLGQSGQAVRNGFLAAYYYSLKNGQSDTAIHIFDTSNGRVSNIYAQAVKDGDQFIIGPLTKDNVQTLANKYSLKIPTLALNTVNNYSDYNVHNLLQFGLSSQDEAYQVARRAWQSHPGRALIIARKNNWGQTGAKVITNTWQALGGTIAETLMYQNNNLRQQIRKVLNINMSQTNASNLRNILGEDLKFIPRRRHDLDVIFLVSLPKEGRSIRPLLNFYFAGDIPTYATSAIYSGIPQPNLDRDLDGIIFCDMPWTLPQANKLPPFLVDLRSNIAKLWPYSYQKYPRLYALGIDAYFLMLNINKLLQHPHNGIIGSTGTFYINNYNHIYRQLDWATMDQGVPHALT